MARRLVGQDGFADHLFVERDGVNSVLRDLFAAIDWNAVESLLGDIEPKRRGGTGLSGYRAVAVFVLRRTLRAFRPSP